MDRMVVRILSAGNFVAAILHVIGFLKTLPGPGPDIIPKLYVHTDCLEFVEPTAERIY